VSGEQSVSGEPSPDLIAVAIPATPGRTMAQLDMQEKNAISHRGYALEELMNRLRKL